MEILAAAKLLSKAAPVVKQHRRNRKNRKLGRLAIGIVIQAEEIPDVDRPGWMLARLGDTAPGKKATAQQLVDALVVAHEALERLEDVGD